VKRGTAAIRRGVSAGMRRSARRGRRCRPAGRSEQSVAQEFVERRIVEPEAKDVGPLEKQTVSKPPVVGEGGEVRPVHVGELPRRWRGRNYRGSGVVREGRQRVTRPARQDPPYRCGVASPQQIQSIGVPPMR
jgi:hypothetical protein